MNAIIADGAKKLLRSGVSTSRRLSGFSESEIGELCQAINLQLPEAYLDFLRVVGHRAGGLLRGTDLTFCSIDEVVAMQAKCREVLSKESVVLPESVFFFALHLGYQMALFDTVTATDDPAVSVLTVADAGIERKSFPSFTEWFVVAIDDQIRLIRYLNS